MKTFAVNTADSTYRVYPSMTNAKASETTGSGFKKYGAFWECESSRLILFTEKNLDSFTGGRTLKSLGYNKI